jgi:RNA recognition motif-containing protein
MRDPESGRARGFAFVEMVNEQDAAKAIQQFHNSQVQGRALTVTEARPKTARAGY